MYGILGRLYILFCSNDNLKKMPLWWTNIFYRYSLYFVELGSVYQTRGERIFCSEARLFLNNPFSHYFS